MDQRERTTQSLYGRDGRRKYLTPAERSAFMHVANALPSHSQRSFCLVLAYCGCRISEALAVRPCDILHEDCTILFRTLKKRGHISVRAVPAPDYLVAMMLAAPARADDQRLWSWSRSRAWQVVKATMVTAGITAGPHQTAKGLRHAFGIHAVRSNVPLNMVQRWLGHASLTTTAIYTDALGAEERELAARMWTALGG